MWVPHLLSAELKEKRLQLAGELLAILEKGKKNSWCHLITEDKPWFVLSCSPVKMRVLSKDGVVAKPKRVIDGKKFMATTIWNPHELYIVDLLPDGANSTRFISSRISWHDFS
jgi:hypothetical protein